MDSYGPRFAVDGYTAMHDSSGGFFHTNVGDTAKWLSIDLGTVSVISQLVLYNRMDCCGERLLNAEIRVGMNGISSTADNGKLSQNAVVWKQPAGTTGQTGEPIIISLSSPIYGRWVTLQNLNPDSGGHASE